MGEAARQQGSKVTVSPCHRVTVSPCHPVTVSPGHPVTLGVLEAVAEAAPRCQHVRIDKMRLAEVCAGIRPADVRLPTWNFPTFYRADPDALAGQILLFNAVNFCYWGDPPWEIEFAGQWWGGSMAMLAAIHRALDEGIPLLDGVYLSRLSEKEFGQILRGRGALHLLPERLAIWRALGEVLVERFENSLTGVIFSAGGDALALVHALVDNFPSFEDTATLEGQPVHFYKRGQLAAAMLFEAFGGRGWGALARTDQLTVFADYKLPQVLRRLGILVYDAGLAAAVDGRTLIPAGDRREVEIRIATVQAAELMRRNLVARLPEITALHIDYWLWFAGRQQGPGVKPYHRTLTTGY